jgi:hypothetical protein
VVVVAAYSPTRLVVCDSEILATERGSDMPPQSPKATNQATNHSSTVVMVEVSHSLDSFPKLAVDDGENCYRKSGSCLCLPHTRLQMIFPIHHSLLQKVALQYCSRKSIGC